MLQASLVFYVGTYCMARAGLDRVRGDYVALGRGARIWGLIGVSLVLLVKKKSSGRSGWILQFCASTAVCTAGVENRDLAF